MAIKNNLQIKNILLKYISFILYTGFIQNTLLVQYTLYIHHLINIPTRSNSNFLKSLRTSICILNNIQTKLWDYGPMPVKKKVLCLFFMNKNQCGKTGQNGLQQVEQADRTLFHYRANKFIYIVI